MKMKKFILIIALLFTIVLAIPVAGCNRQVIDLNYKFSRASVYINGEWKDLAIKTWSDYEGEQLQLTLKDGTVLIVHSANCILYEGELP